MKLILDKNTTYELLDSEELQEAREYLTRSIGKAKLPDYFNNWKEVAQALRECKTELNRRYLASRGL
jgi:hypothetical protein